MTDAEEVARSILAELQGGFVAHDLDAVTTLLDDEVVVFGTAAENLDGEQSRDYIARMLARDDTVRWSWERVIPLVFETAIVSFAVVGTVGFEGAQGSALGARQPFRLTCVAVMREGRWRLRHFHGSVPQS